ncbi:MAG TPA: NYN domain-containing protein [Gemmatimonadales bacterium]|nr:NYN domain-containing protein [Gemmatimonadales bacterium]
MIDFDNVTMGIRSDLQSELKRLLQSDIIRGKVAVQRAYADWRRYPQYIVPLSESSIDLIFAPAYGSSKKNATDIRLAIDALELVFTRPEIGTFILLSGDSDFSSLVLKLKEYGKYVIGVGIRESSSDLLIQNCDEYFSYNELAGLTKESDVEHVRRDPWELVIEAVKQMTAHNDVMRSDRLKQVMQEIDPSFDEKDAGFSRFSKFVQEAAHRGLIATTRLDNGQYEIALGQKAETAAATPGVYGEAPAPAPAAPEPPPPAPPHRRSSIVGDAFGLLKQALGRLGGEQEVSAETVREAMNELAPEGTRRVDSRSMPKLLRQAHDADLIDLSKDESGSYSVRVKPEEQPEAARPPVARAQEEEAEEPEPPMPTSSAPPPPYSQPTSPFGGMPARSARFRRGSRGPRPASPGAPRVGIVEVDANFRPRVEPVSSRPTPSPQGGGEAVGPGRDDDERPRRERGGRGRGGRGRGARGRNGGEGGGDTGGGGERSARGRRGGRGRGGRGGGRNEERGGGGERSAPDRGDRGESYRQAPPPAFEAAPPPPAPERSAPTPPPAPSQKDEGDSFWSRVKRGIIGGE